MRRALAAVAVAVVVACAASVPAPAQTTETPSPQRLETFEFPSDLVDTTSPGGRLSNGRSVPAVNVLLPEGYDSDSDADFPVLWLLHGANLGTDFWPDSSFLAGFDEFDGIVVMPDGGTLGMYSDWWNGGRRGGPAWATYHLTELFDHVAATYRIRPGRRWHTIMGISMGGQGALRYAALRPDYFGSVVAFSAAMPDIQNPIFQVGLAVVIAAGAAPGGVDYTTIWGSPTGAYAEGNSPQALIDNLAHTRVFLASGNGVNCPQDPVATPEGLVLDTVTEAGISVQQLQFQLALESAGVDVTARSACGIHTYPVWNRAMSGVLRWGLFDRAVPPPDTWAYRTIARSGTVWDVDFAFDDPPGAVVRFAGDGDRLRAAGSGAVTLTDADGCTRHETLPFDVSRHDGWTCPTDEAVPPDVDVAPVAAPRTDRGQLPATGSAAVRALVLALAATAAALALRVTNGVRPHP